MISILICSIQPRLLQQVSDNIAATIGTPFEILAADNRGTQKGICQVYNELAAKAQFPILVFVHEDVVFNRPRWGVALAQIFTDHPDTGVVGIAGSNYKSGLYTGWHTGVKENDAFHIMHITDGKQNPLKHYRSTPAELYDAVCVDGVFIASTLQNWQAIRFNEDQLKGFHFYDIDFSLRSYLHGQKVWIWMNLQLEHLTVGGDFGTPWVKDAILFHQYMKKHLPCGQLAAGGNAKEIAGWWLDFLKAFKIDWSLKMQWIFQQNLWRQPGNYYRLLKFLLYTPLGMKALHQWWKNHR